MTDLYIVILQERHIGVDAFPFTSKAAANLQAHVLADEYVWEGADIEVEYDDDELVSIKFSEEGGYVGVVAREVDAK